MNHQSGADKNHQEEENEEANIQLRCFEAIGAEGDNSRTQSDV